MSIAPVNPVDFMGDIIINEGTHKPMRTTEDKQEAFRQILVEQVFLKNIFDNENSIYKPEKDEEGFSSGMSTIYGQYMRKKTAEYIVQQGFLKNEVNERAGK